MNYEPNLHVVLHQPDIPYNAGNVGRTCVATACKLWLVRPLGFHVDDRHMRRAGLDYWEHLDWAVADHWDDLLAQLGDRPLWVFSKTATREYTTVEYQRGDAVVFGSETAGLPPSMLQHYADRALKIPIRPQVRSLNLSNAAAIVIYEALRQWAGRGEAAL